MLLQRLTVEEATLLATVVKEDGIDREELEHKLGCSLAGEEHILPEQINRKSEYPLVRVAWFQGRAFFELTGYASEAIPQLLAELLGQRCGVVA
jgi:hypothetical protein